MWSIHNHMLDLQLSRDTHVSFFLRPWWQTWVLVM